MDKIYCSDLDGTLLLDNGNISVQDLQTIKKILDRNIFTIATGRRYKNVKTIIKSLEKYNLNNLFIICSEGQIIYDGYGNLIYEAKYFTTNDILSIFNDSQQFFHLYSNNCDFSIEKNNLKRFILNLKLFLKRKLQVKRYISPNKLFAIDWNKFKIDKIRTNKITNNIENNYNCNFFELEYTEITPLMTNKYLALKWIAKFNNIEENYIIALGDDANDLELAKNLKFFYAVINGKNYLKKEAFFVLNQNNNENPLTSMYRIHKELEENGKNENDYPKLDT